MLASLSISYHRYAPRSLGLVSDTVKDAVLVPLSPSGTLGELMVAIGAMSLSSIITSTSE